VVFEIPITLFVVAKVTKAMVEFFMLPGPVPVFAALVIIAVLVALIYVLPICTTLAGMAPERRVHQAMCPCPTRKGIANSTRLRNIFLKAARSPLLPDQRE